MIQETSKKQQYPAAPHNRTGDDAEGAKHHTPTSLEEASGPRQAQPEVTEGAGSTRTEAREDTQTSNNDVSKTSRLKREETEPADIEGSSRAADVHAIAPIQVPDNSEHGRSRRASRASKPQTPVDTKLAQEGGRGRNGRNGSSSAAVASAASTPNIPASMSPSKRSRAQHAATVASAKASANEVDNMREKSKRPTSPGEEVEQVVEEADEADEDEPRYCTCGGVSYGNMIACDNTACPREWFHLECVGLEKAPSSKTKWYCTPKCRDEAKGVSRR